MERARDVRLCMNMYVYGADRIEIIWSNQVKDEHQQSDYDYDNTNNGKDIEPTTDNRHSDLIKDRVPSI